VEVLDLLTLAVVGVEMDPVITPVVAVVEQVVTAA
jgi:hypothetical protein